MRVEHLGDVTVPSGIVLVVDTGLLNLWSHDRSPLMPEGVLDEEATARANTAIDFRLEGRDAERAGRALNKQWDPRFLFDIPGRGVAGTQELFETCLRANGLDARLVPLQRRITHRERADLALECGGGAGEVTFQGICASVVGGVPVDRPLRVFGERLAEGPYTDRWRWVYLECRPGAVVERSEQIGSAGVDKARLMFGDVDALGAWQHETPLDGKADYVFWGRDAELAANQTGAHPLGDHQWGWVNLSHDEAVERGLEVQRLRDEHGWRMAVDFRPHSHHYLVMQQTRSTPTESGTVEVGGARMCTFMTSWGDGFFPVLRDLDSEGRLVRIRIDLGNEKVVERQRKMEERWFGEFAKCALVSRRVWDEGEITRWLYREDPHDEEDSGWRVFAGDESPEYVNAEGNCCVVPLRDLLERDATLESILRTPSGSAFERTGPGDPFRPVEDFYPSQEEGNEED